MGMLSNGGLELGRFGHLTLLAGRLHISANGIDTELPKPWTDSTVAYWLDDQPGNLLIAPTREDHLFRVDLNQLSVEPLGKLQRFKDGGLRRIKLFGHGPDVIPAYELGAVYIEQGLILRWHIHLQTIDWFADSIDDGALWLRSEHGGRVGYRLSDGQPLTNHR
jgi:hypothetical protein